MKNKHIILFYLYRITIWYLVQMTVKLLFGTSIKILNKILNLQNHYLVSGSNDSEITVWDINKPPAPISPGKRNTPLAPITSLAWNKQV